MVWVSQGSVNDSSSGIDTVRSKPLKKRCCSRAGLSRYYSSKSQSFSSLDLVQCTQFGTSAMALAKRPPSFDLRRISLRAGSGLSHATSSCLRSNCEQETSMSVTNEEEEQDAPERCPCNDTIFTNPAEVFMSPSGSPSSSPLQSYDPCTLSSVSLGSCQQQRQYQLTAEYLTHLSVLLPLQPSFSVNASIDGSTGAAGTCSLGCACGTTRGGLSAALSGSCSSSCGGNGCSSKSLSSGSSSAVAASFCCDSTAASPSGRLWPTGGVHLTGLSYGGGVDRPVCCAAEAAGAASNRTWPQYAAVSSPVTGLETVTQTLIQSCSDDLKSVGIGAGCGRAASGGAMTHIVTASQNAVCAAANSLSSGGSASRPRNCLSAGGYMSPMPHNSGTLVTATVALAGSATTAMAVATETSCSCGHGNGGHGGGSVPSLGRKLGLGIANRRLRAAQAAGLVAVHSARQAAAGLWGSTEDMIASLTLSDRQQQSHQHQQLSMGRAPRSSSLSRGSEGFCWFASSGPRWQQQQQQLEAQRSNDSTSPHLGLGREGLPHPTGALPGAAAASATPVPVAARAVTLATGRVSESSFAAHSCVSLSDFGGRNLAAMQQQQQPQYDQWLCSSAPPASATFNRFNGACY